MNKQNFTNDFFKLKKKYRIEQCVIFFINKDGHGTLIKSEETSENLDLLCNRMDDVLKELCTMPFGSPERFYPKKNPEDN